MTMKRLQDFPLVYLGTPYTKYPGGIWLAYVDASYLAGKLLKAGVKVYSPIAHTHPIANYSGLDPLDHKIWLPFDEAIMDKADAMAVGMLPSWESSYGIKHEIETFQKAGKPIFYLNPDTLEIKAYSVGFGDDVAPSSRVITLEEHHDLILASQLTTVTM